MCVMCDGATREEVREHLYRQIRMRGYALVPVGSGWDEHGWAYTIGLVDGHDHPELVIIDHPLGEAAAVLDELARSVTHGDRFDSSDAEVPSGQIGFVDVVEAHLRRGLMDSWFDYYWAAGRLDLELEAMQVVLPDGFPCHEHRPTQPRLDIDRHVAFDGMNGPVRFAHPRRKRE